MSGYPVTAIQCDGCYRWVFCDGLYKDEDVVSVLRKNDFHVIPEEIRQQWSGGFYEPDDDCILSVECNGCRMARLGVNIAFDGYAKKGSNKSCLVDSDLAHFPQGYFTEYRLMILSGGNADRRRIISYSGDNKLIPRTPFDEGIEAGTHYVVEHR